jgi:hypothetical protein
VVNRKNEEERDQIEIEICWISKERDLLKSENDTI